MDDITTATPYGTFALDLGADGVEAKQMQPFAADQSAPWWQSMIMYGATRAIDNRFGPVNVAGDVGSGTYAGQNGRTYLNTPVAQRGQVVAGLDNGLLLLLALGAVAVVALKD
jgi:hypothetical protein